MNYKNTKILEKTIKLLNSDQKVGTYQDLKTIEVSIFFSTKDNFMKNSMLFSIANRRNDNDKISTWRFLSFEDLVELGVSEIDLLKKLENKAINEKHKNIKNMINKKNVNKKIPCKKIYIDEEREFCDAKILLSNLRKTPPLFPYQIRNNNSLNPNETVNISNKELIRLKSIIARNKKDRVFNTSQNILGDYISIPLRGKKEINTKSLYIYADLKTLLPYLRR